MGTLSNRYNEYSRVYSNFRGVDFSTDHSQILPSRLAYCENMYKDYRCGRGVALETIPGFTKRYFTGISGATIDSDNKREDMAYNSRILHFTDDKGNFRAFLLRELELDIPSKTGHRYIIHRWDSFPEEQNIRRELRLECTSEDVTDAGENIEVRVPIQLKKKFDAKTECDLISLPESQYENKRFRADFVSRGEEAVVMIVAKSQNNANLSLQDFINHLVMITYYEYYMDWYEGQIFDTSETGGPLDDFGIDRKQVEYKGSYEFNNALYINFNNFLLRVRPSNRDNGYFSSLFASTTEVEYSSSESMDTGRFDVPLITQNIIYAGDSKNEGITFQAKNVYIPNIYKLGFKYDPTHPTIPLKDYVSLGDEIIAVPEAAITILGEAETTKFYSGVYLPSTGEADTVYYGTDESDWGDYSLYGYGTKPCVWEGGKYVSRFTIDSNWNLTIKLPPKENASVVVMIRCKKREDLDYPPLFNASIFAEFDQRIFMSGYESQKFNHVITYFSKDINGDINPLYVNAISNIREGKQGSPIRGMLQVGDSLAVFKGYHAEDGSVYFINRVSTGDELNPVAYASQQGLTGSGCYNSKCCANFFDDPVYLSSEGLVGLSKLQIASERSTSQRSTLINSKLLTHSLEKAQICLWENYLCIYVDGDVFMADSNQKYADEQGRLQYEWYYLSKIGLWADQYVGYTYAKRMSPELGFSNVHVGQNLKLEIADKVYNIDTDEYDDLRGLLANPPNEYGYPTELIESEEVQLYLPDDVEHKYPYKAMVYYVTHRDKDDKERAYLLSTTGEKIGGEFFNAQDMFAYNGTLFFTIGGNVCAFNTDKRDKDGTIPHRYYNFDGRTICSGCATLMDNCGIPYYTKSTIKNSTVVKTRSFDKSGLKVRVRTNKTPYKQVDRLNTSLFDFVDMDFEDFTFITQDQGTYLIKEKEKRWVEKQFYIYTDEFERPFALYTVAFRYKNHGRVKND